MKTIRFDNIPKNTLSVEMPNHKILLVYPPKKSVMDQLAALTEMEAPDAERVYRLAAAILSNNKQGVLVDVQELAQLDVADIGYLMKSYISFVTEEMNRPN